MPCLYGDIMKAVHLKKAIADLPDDTDIKVTCDGMTFDIESYGDREEGEPLLLLVMPKYLRNFT